MLILNRKIDQTIVIRGDITLSVLAFDRGTIKLGFKAPDDVHILRGELVGSGYEPHALHKKADGMLVLDRKVDEDVLIGENIHVKVLGMTRNRVQVGVVAPHDVTVLRGELLNESRVHGSKERF